MSLADLGLFISLAFPLTISIYKETRFVKKQNLLVYGISLIVFSLSYTSYNLPENFKHLEDYHWIFLIVGIFMLLFYFGKLKNPINMDKAHSLVYSWKNFGAFEFAFIAPIYFTKIPKGFFTFFINQPILNLGLNLLIVFWALAFGFRFYKNWLRKTN